MENEREEGRGSDGKIMGGGGKKKENGDRNKEKERAGYHVKRKCCDAFSHPRLIDRLVL